MKNEYRKMKVLLGAGIARARELGVWDGRNGSWDVARAVSLHDSGQHFLNTQAGPPLVGMIRSAGGLSTICTLRVIQEEGLGAGAGVSVGTWM